jgi:ubiquinone/menaquinone biosynthesis C-methylase UbiE
MLANLEANGAVALERRRCTMAETHKTYLPAAGHDWLLPLYDPIVKLLGGDAARRALLEQAPMQPGQRVLDIGCGTGSLVVLMKRLHPDVDVVGLDPDPKALARGRRKAARASVSVQFDQGFADALPYPDASVDRVFSSFMFHHLARDEQAGMLWEVRRILRPGGVFLLLDFGGPEAGADGFLARLIHSSPHLRDNAEDHMLALLRQAGFASPQKVSQGAMLLGRVHINYYEASVPTSEVGVVQPGHTAIPGGPLERRKGVTQDKSDSHTPARRYARRVAVSEAEESFPFSQGRDVTGGDHLCNRQELRCFLAQSIHTCDTLSSRTS